MEQQVISRNKATWPVHDTCAWHLPQNIAQLEVKLERQDMSGMTLRAAIAKLEAYSSATEVKTEEVDSELLDLDRELTILKSNV